MSDTIADGRAPSKKRNSYTPKKLIHREVYAADLRKKNDDGTKIESVQNVLDRLAYSAYDDVRDMTPPKPRLEFLEYLAVRYRALGLTTAETVQRIATRDGYEVSDRHVRGAWERYVAFHGEVDRHRLVPKRFSGHRCPEPHDVDLYVNHFPPGPELAARRMPVAETNKRRSEPLPSGDWLAAPRADHGFCAHCISLNPVTTWRHRRDSAGQWLEVALCSRCSAWKRGAL